MKRFNKQDGDPEDGRERCSFTLKMRLTREEKDALMNYSHGHLGKPLRLGFKEICRGAIDRAIKEGRSAIEAGQERR